MESFVPVALQRNRPELVPQSLVLVTQLVDGDLSHNVREVFGRSLLVQDRARACADDCSAGQPELRLARHEIPLQASASLPPAASGSLPYAFARLFLHLLDEGRAILEHHSQVNLLGRPQRHVWSPVGEPSVDV